MGTVVRFPVHVRASAADLKPKTERSASLPRRASSSENVKKCSDGIEPLAFQLETAGADTPASAAAAEGPPTASTIASTELSMALDSSHSVNLSSLHVMAVDLRETVQFHCPMQTPRMIGERLVETRRALGRLEGKDELKAVEICNRIGCSPSRWSNYESGEGRPITRAVAERLCEEFGLTLDWIYRGNPAGLPHRLALELRKIAAA